MSNSEQHHFGATRGYIISRRGRHINFGKTALTAVFRANRKCSGDLVGHTPVCSSGRGRNSASERIFFGKTALPFFGQTGSSRAVLRDNRLFAGTATGEKQINNFFRLYVENRPALHGLHFSFVAGRSFPSSVSSADSFPSRGSLSSFSCDRFSHHRGK